MADRDRTDPTSDLTRQELWMAYAGIAVLAAAVVFTIVSIFLG